MTADLVELDRRVVLEGLSLVDAISDVDLERPTPCGSWTVHELLAHMAAQHRGFAAAAAGRGGSLDEWAVRDDDPVMAYRASVNAIVLAFEADGVLEQAFALPEISTEITFKGKNAIGFHLIDYVVHNWDVARSIGLTYDPDPEALAAALAIAERLPDGPERLEPGAAFAPGTKLGEQATPMDRLLALLGRSPDWPA